MRLVPAIVFEPVTFSWTVSLRNLYRHPQCINPLYESGADRVSHVYWFYFGPRTFESTIQVEVVW